MASTDTQTEPMDIDDKLQTCRLCLSDETLRNVFEEKDLHQWICDSLSIMITTEDGMSQSVCAVCRIRLTDFHYYRKRCHSVQNILQATIPEQRKVSELASAPPICHEVQSALIAEIPEQRKDSKQTNPLTRYAKSSARPFQCQICHKVYKLKRHLNDHMRYHRPKNICKWCGKTYAERRRLERHIKKYHTTCEDQENFKSDEEELTEVEVQEIKTEPLEGVEDCITEIQEQQIEKSVASGHIECFASTSNDNSASFEHGAENISFVHDLGVRLCNTTEEEETQIAIEDIVVEEVKLEVPCEFDEPPPVLTEIDANELVDRNTSIQEKVQNIQKIIECEDKEVQCGKCGKTYTSERLLYYHNANVHRPKNYACLTCGRRFHSKRDLRIHFRTKKHLKKKKEMNDAGIANIVTEQNKTDIEPDDDFEMRDFVSNSTGSVADTRSDTFESQRQSINTESIQPETSDEKKQQPSGISDGTLSFEQHGSAENNGRYACAKCNRSFSRECQFKKHMKTHDEKTIDTDDGNSSMTGEDDADSRKPFPSIFNYIQGPNSEQLLQCELCDMVFPPVRKKLLAHKRQAHGPKTFSCPICYKPFRLRDSMEKHMLKHGKRGTTEENISVAKPFECDVCHKKFSLRKTVLDHKKYVHGLTKSDEEELTEVEVQEIETEPLEGVEDSITEIQEQQIEKSVASGHIECFANTSDESLASLEHGAEKTSFVHDLDVGLCNTTEEEETQIDTEDIAVEEVKVEVPCELDEPPPVLSGVQENIQKMIKMMSRCQDKEVQCGKCGKMYKSERLLYCHNANVHGPKKYACLMCGVRYLAERDLRIHFRTKKHLNKKKEMSDAGTMNIVTEQNKTDIEPDDDFEMRDIVSNSAGSLADTRSDTFESQRPSINTESLQSETSDELEQQPSGDSDDTLSFEQHGSAENNGRYACAKCNRSFSRECQFKKHMKAHDEKTIDTDDGNSSMTEEDDADSRKPFPSIFNYIQGPDSEQLLQCELCDMVFPPVRKKLLAHKRQAHGPKAFSCPICYKPFRLRDSMEKHKLKHGKRGTKEENISVAKPFECDVCHKKFSLRKTVLHHKKYVHGPKMHECDICGFRASLRSSLDLHLQRHARHDDRKEDFLRTHGKPQEEKHDEVTNTESVESSNRNGPPKRDVRTICRRCDKVFYDLQAFWTHHKTAHKKKLKCALCNVEFAHKKRLVNHMLTKHKKNDGSYQPLKCDQCDKVFSRTSQLTAHKVVHRPKIHSCHLCSRSFSRPQHLKSHIECHAFVGDDFIFPASTGEGYECEICHKVLQLKKHMKGHIRRVHGSELHKCSICNRLFRTRDELEIHSKGHDNAAEQKVGEFAGNSEAQESSQKETPAGLPDNGQAKRLSPEKYIEDEREDEFFESEDSESEKKPKRQKLRRHTKRSSRAIHSCSVCSLQFTSKKKLEQHIKTSHQEGAGVEEESQSHVNSISSLDQTVSIVAQEVNVTDTPEGPVLLFQAEQFKIEPE